MALTVNITSHDTPAYDTVPQYHVCLQKVQQFRRYNQDNQNFECAMWPWPQKLLFSLDGLGFYGKESYVPKTQKEQVIFCLYKSSLWPWLWKIVTRFFYDTLAYDGVSLQVWSQKVQQFRWYRQDKQLKCLNTHCDPDLEQSNPIFSLDTYDDLHRFGCRRIFSSSEYIVQSYSEYINLHCEESYSEYINLYCDLGLEASK